MMGRLPIDCSRATVDGSFEPELIQEGSKTRIDGAG